MFNQDKHMNHDVFVTVRRQRWYVTVRGLRRSGRVNCSMVQGPRLLTISVDGALTGDSAANMARCMGKVMTML